MREHIGLRGKTFPATVLAIYFAPSAFVVTETPSSSEGMPPYSWFTKVATHIRSLPLAVLYRVALSRTMTKRL